MNFDQSEIENNDYLSERIDPLFRKLMKDILKDKPFDIVNSKPNQTKKAPIHDQLVQQREQR
jgi:hypothetical protein